MVCNLFGFWVFSGFFLSLSRDTYLYRAHQVFVVLFQAVIKTWGLTRQRVQDFTLYCGTLGTACLLLKAYQVTNNKNDLNLCSEIIKSCDSASLHSRYSLSHSLLFCLGFIK